MNRPPNAPQAMRVPLGPLAIKVAEIAYRARRAVLLQGETGIGKSELMQAVANRLGIELVVLDLSLLEPPDLVGLPREDAGRTVYAPPDILPKPGTSGILLLEELNRCETFIRQPALLLLTARRLNGYVLPEGWSVFAAINPDNGDYQVSALDPALRARFLQLDLVPDRKAWVDWARVHGVHPAIVSIARQHDGVFDEVAPRTWTYASDVLLAMDPEERADDTLVRCLLGGYLPMTWVEVLLADPALMACTDDLDVDRLLHAYDRDRSLQAAVGERSAKGRTDTVDSLVRRIEGILRGPEMSEMVSSGRFRLAAFEALLADLPGDRVEQLQEAFAANPAGCRLISAEPIEVLREYRGGPLERRVKQWARDRLRTHRLGSLVTAVRLTLERVERPWEFRRQLHPRVCLGYFLRQLGRQHAASLNETLKRLNIEPVYPKHAA